MRSDVQTGLQNTYPVFRQIQTFSNFKYKVLVEIWHSYSMQYVVVRGKNMRAGDVRVAEKWFIKLGRIM